MSRQSSLNVSLTPALESYVREKVTAGKYETASEVIRDGLRALQERDRSMTAFWTDVREKVAVGLNDLRAGRLIDGPGFMSSLLTASARRRSPGRTNSGERSAI